MSLKRNLLTAKAVIETVLTTDTKARNSDTYLYLRVFSMFALTKGIDLETLSVADFLRNMKEYGFPSFETIRRARQKLQAENPALAADCFTKEKRAENETIYNAFAKEGA